MRFSFSKSLKLQSYCRWWKKLHNTPVDWSCDGSEGDLPAVKNNDALRISESSRASFLYMANCGTNSKWFQIHYIFPSMGTSLAAVMMLFFFCYWVQMKLGVSVDICQTWKVLRNIIRVLGKVARGRNAHIKDKSEDCCCEEMFNFTVVKNLCDVLFIFGSQIIRQVYQMLEFIKNSWWCVCVCDSCDSHSTCWLTKQNTPVHS